MIDERVPARDALIFVIGGGIDRLKILPQQYLLEIIFTL